MYRHQNPSTPLTSSTLSAPSSLKRAPHKGLRGLLVFTQVVSTLSATVLGLAQPTLPESIASLQPLIGLPQPAAALTGQPDPVVAGGNSITVTKSVIGSTQSNYTITVQGPSYPSGAQMGIVSGTQVITGLVPGVYTVTETSPGAGWLITTTTSGTAITTPVTSANQAIVTLTGVITAPLVAAGPITGTVWQDFNSDGNIQRTATYSEPGQSGVTVTAYDRNGNAVGSTTPLSNGTYSLTPSAAGPWRLEFTNLPAGFEPSRVFTGTQNGSSVQFINSLPVSGGANFGIARSCDYCQSSPDLVTTHLLYGDPSLAPLSTLSGLTHFKYDSPSTLTTDASVAQIGAAWGIGYQRNNRLIFTGAVQRRFSGYGPLGPGGIYYFNRNTNTTVNWLDVDTLPGVASGTDPHTTLPAVGGSTAVRDPASYDTVGKMSLGDIDVSDDQTTLWAMNLNQRTLLEIPLVGSPPVTPASAKVHDVSNLVTCPNGEFRPWATKFYNNKIYIGGVCSGENGGTRADLSAHVFAHDPAGSLSSFTFVYSESLNYSRPCTINFGGLQDCAGWNVWQSTWPTGLVSAGGYYAKAQPILMDIEFDVNGSMILGYGDRWGFQTGNANYQPNTPDVTSYTGTTAGDIKRVCLVNNAFVGEGGVGCTQTQTDVVSTTLKEYYEDSVYGPHPESAVGALALLPGRGEVASTKIDPDAVFAVGVTWLENATGNKWRGDFVTRGTGNPSYNKAASIGDLELLCDAAPIEIGNRVWQDLNENGVQDPGEPPISGVIVSLQTPSGTITTTTNISGSYYFTREATTGAYTQTLRPNTAYTITINPAQTALTGYMLTTPDAQAISGSPTSNHAISDTRDSDASLIGGLATIYYTTGDYGQNNHGLDYGFVPPARATVAITNHNTNIEFASFGNFVWIESDGDGIAATGTITPVVGKVITATASNGLVYTQTTNGQGYYTFTVPSGLAYTVNYGPAPAGTAPSATPNPGTASGTSQGTDQRSRPNDTGVTLVVNDVIPTIDFGFYLLPPNPPVTGAITVTKQVTGTNGTNGTFNVNVIGPNGYVSNTTISNGSTVVFTNLLPGVYTVTEASPGAGWLITTTTSGSAITTPVTSANQAIVTLTGVITAPLVAAGPITGTVFNDYNSDGNIQRTSVISEGGVGGVTVTAYDRNGNAVGSTATLSNGTYSLTPSAAGPWRIEFTNLPAGYEPSRVFTGPSTGSGQNGSSVQFINSLPVSGGANFGIVRPCDYCQNNPYLATPQMFNGDPLLAGNSSTEAISRLRYETPTSDQTISTQGQMGSVWGIAYSRPTDVLYASAMTRRHAGLGPNGLGAIYQIPNAQEATVGTPALFVDLAAQGVNVGTVLTNGARGLAGSGSQNLDATTFDAVGKIGLGDLDITQDGSTLWAVNLNERTLVKIPVASPTAGNITSYPIPLPTCGTVSDAAGSALRINVGGNLFTDAGSPSRRWITDTESLFGSVQTSASAITNINNPGDGTGTTGQTVYQAMRTGSAFSYTLTLPNGAYNIRLHFAEIGGVTNRGFTVRANNATQLSGFNPYAAAGNVLNRAVMQSFTVNVTDGRLILDFVDEAGGSASAIVNGIEAIAQSGTLSAGQFRPWAVKMNDRDGKVYVGGVCDAQTSQLRSDLSGLVYKFDPAALTFSTVLTFPLNYRRGNATEFYGDCAGSDPNSVNKFFNPWTATGANWLACGPHDIYPQAILSDIEFDDDGSMILGFFDRWGHQVGSNAMSLEGVNAEWNGVVGGEILRAYNNNGTFVMENNGVAGPVSNTNGSNVNEGPGGREFYFGDTWVGVHRERGEGGLAMLPGSQRIAQTAMDGDDGFFAQTVQWLSNVNGERTDGYYLGGNFEKSNGLGDLEVLCDVAPIEIGNRVWQDVNNNGVQDPGEPPIAGVQVQLIDPATGGVLQTTTTNISGTYYFTREAATGAYSTTLRPNTQYSISIATGQTALNGYTLTTKDTQAISGATNSNDNILDVRDSDGTLLGSTAQIFYTTGGFGQNNHGLDFGFTRNPTATVAITNTAPPLFDLGNYVWFDTNNNGITDTGELGVAGVTVTLQTPTGLLTTTTNAQGYYSFTNLVAGTYTPTIAASNFAAGAPLANYLSSSGATSTYNAGDNSRDHGIDPANAAAYLSSGVSGAPVTLGTGLQPTNENPGTPTTPNGDVNNNLTADFGFYKQEIGNTIWIDSNDDGLLNNGEQPFTAGPITVTLVDNVSGAVVSSTVTNNGIYTFTSVPSGTFVVSITVPAGYTSSTPTTNTVGVDNNDNGSPSGAFIVSAPFTATPGTSLNAITSNNANGTTRNPSIDFGLTSPTAQFGDRVWIESDSDGDAATGVITPVLGMVITATDGTSTYTRTTNAQGYYSFTVPPGTYTVTYGPVPPSYGGVVPSSTPLGSSASGDAGSYAQPGNPDQSRPQNSTVTLAADEANWTMDYAFNQPLYDLGNRVWFDANNDGVLNNGEQPVNGVTMQLRDSTGAVVGTTTTNAQGYYSFTHLLPGTYSVTVAASNFAPTGPLANYWNSSPTTAPSNNAADNNQDHGINPATYAAYLSNGVSSGPITLGAGLPTGEDGSAPTTPNGDANNNLTIDFGFYKQEIGNTIWVDGNNDGLLNNGELPYTAGPITVTLVDSASGAVVSVTVTTNGVYTFTGVPSGTFVVSITVPANYTSSTGVNSTAGVDANDNGSPSGAFIVSAPFTATPGTALNAITSNNANGTTTNPSIDFGLVQLPVQFGDRVWIESDSDGNANSGTVTPVQGMVITATSFDPGSGGTNTYTQTTNAQGYYSFTVPAGTYTVTYGPVPAVYGAVVPSATPANNSASGNAGSYQQAGNPDQSRPQNSTVTLTPGQANWTMDYAFNIPSAQFGDRAWIESDTDGVASTGVITPIAGLVITATSFDPGSGGPNVYTTTTNAQGYYSFTVPAGTYTVTYGAVPASYGNVVPSATPFSNSANGNAGSYQQNGNPDQSRPQSSTITLTPGQSNWTMDYAFNVPKYDLGNYVWFDTNNDGLLNNSEQPVNGVVMQLRDSTGAVIAATMTDASGYYSFTNLLAGTYSVTVAASNFAPTGSLANYWNSSPTIAPSNNAADNNQDHGINPATYAAYLSNGVSSGPITLGAGLPTNEDSDAPTTPNGDANNNLTIDFGFYKQEIGNRVWYDNDGNGSDNNEPPATGVPVTLTDALGNVISTTTTNAQGYYTFTGVPSGTFIVKIQAPTGYASTDPDDASGNTDLNDNGVGPGFGVISSQVFTLTPGTNSGAIVATNNDGTTRNPSIDFGLVRSGIDVVKYTNGYNADTLADPRVRLLPGQPVTWTYVIRNLGSTVLNNIQLNDDRISTAGASCAPVALGSTLGVSGVTTCTISSIANAAQADVTGIYTNVATTSGTPPGGSPLTSTNPSHYQVITPSIALRKYTLGYDADTLADQRPQLRDGVPVTWTYVVTNTGNITLSNLTLNDDRQSLAGANCAPVALGGALAAGQVTTCTLSSNAQAAATANGIYTNTAVVTGTPSLPPLPPPDLPSFPTPPTSTLPLTATNPSHYEVITPAIKLTKLTIGFDADTLADVRPQLRAGDAVTWTYLVTNTGNVTLNPVILTDDYEGTITCPQVSLIAGASMTCTRVGTAQLARVDGNGVYTNTAIVTGTPPVQPPPPPSFPPLPPTTPPTDTNPSHYQIVTPSIALVKYTNGYDADTLADARALLRTGDAVLWTYVIRNTGNVALSNLTLGDDRISTAGASCAPVALGGTLAVSGVTTCSVSSTAQVTQTVGNVYTNTGNTSGTPVVPPGNPALPPLTATNPSHYEIFTPTIQLTKWTNGFDADAQSDPQPVLNLNDPVIWTYVFTNTSVVSLSNLALTDDQEGNLSGRASCSPINLGGTLTPGQSTTCTLTSTATGGQYVNIGTVYGTPVLPPPPPPQFPPPVPQPPVTSTNPSRYFGAGPGIVVRKYTNGYDADVIPFDPQPFVLLGQPVTWTYVLTNTGNVTLSNVTLNDDVIGSVNSNASATCTPLALSSLFAPGAVTTCTLPSTANVTGQYTNTAVVTGTNALSPTQKVSDTNPSHYFGATPKIDVRKYTNGFDADTMNDPRVWLRDGDGVMWTYIVTNTGNVVLTNLTLSDDRVNTAGASCSPVALGGTLAVGQVTTCTLPAMASAAQTTNGVYTNTAVVTGTPPILPPPTIPGFPTQPPLPSPTATNPSHYEVMTPSLALTKWTNGYDADLLNDPQAQLVIGAAVTWTYRVTNTGNITLTNLNLVDDKEGGVTCPQSTLPPGASMTCTKLGIATLGQYTNTGIVTGTPSTPPYTPTLPGAPPPTPFPPITSTNPSHYNGVTAGLGDYVWEDLDHDGYQDTNEPGIPGVSVKLLDGNGNVLTTTTTDANGYYSFTNLTPGVPYVVQFGTPATYQPTTQNADNLGLNGPKNSDASPTTGKTVSVTLGANEFNPNLDAGFWRPASLGNFVWFDDNKNGMQDSGEAGVPGVRVNLFDAAGVLIRTTTTDEFGYYLFTNLISGSYQVQFDVSTLPTGYEPTKQGATGSKDGPDSDPDPVTGRTELIPLNAGENDPTWDLGIVQKLSGLGNYVWSDVDRDGIQDANEKPVPGVLVTLYDVNGKPISTTMTDVNGFYVFTNLVPGTYSVGFTAPNGFTFTLPGTSATSDNDSNANPQTGRTQPVVLAPGEFNPTIDAGLVPLASLGDFVWSDQNHDGKQDPGEPGVPGVTVTLKDGDGQVVATTTTNASGAYSFTNLIPGTYVVVFTIPQGYTFTTPNVGNDNTDSDAVPQADALIGVVPPVVLAPGENNTTIDAGVWVPARLGDFVWYDVNRNGVQDVGEVGVPGVTVTLYQRGSVLSTTVTTADGRYLFDNLTPGDYYVVFTLPNGFTFTLKNSGNAQSDSNADPVTGQSSTTTIEPGEDDRTWDAGIWLPLPALNLRKTAQTGGAAVKQGDLVTYTIVVSNSGPGIANNVVITDPLPSSLLYEPGSAKPAATYANKTLTWTKATLKPGERYTMTFMARVQTLSDPNATQIVNLAYTSATGPANVPVFIVTPPLRADDQANVPLAPNFVTLSSFTARWVTNTVAINWVTGVEVNTFGFALLRSQSNDIGAAVKLNSALIPARGANGGASYDFVDTTVDASRSDIVYYYWLQEVETNGTINTYGPVKTERAAPKLPTKFVVFLPMINKSK